MTEGLQRWIFETDEEFAARVARGGSREEAIKAIRAVPEVSQVRGRGDGESGIEKSQPSGDK